MRVWLETVNLSMVCRAFVKEPNIFSRVSMTSFCCYLRRWLLYIVSHSLASLPPPILAMVMLSVVSVYLSVRLSVCKITQNSVDGFPPILAHGMLRKCIFIPFMVNICDSESMVVYYLCQQAERLYVWLAGRMRGLVPAHWRWLLISLPLYLEYRDMYWVESTKLRYNKYMTCTNVWYFEMRIK